MKRILLAICLNFLFATCTFAGETFIFAPVSPPTGDEIDTYIVAGDRGTDVVHLFKIDDESYAIVNENETTVIIKAD